MRKNIYHANISQKKAGVAILISDKVDFRTMNIIREKQGYYIIITKETVLLCT